jgi:polyisoprenyl-phosphate glycosyltransferase
MLKQVEKTIFNQYYRMKISIIIPCFNNAGSIPDLWNRLKLVSNKPIFSAHCFEFVFVDDGSIDETYMELEKLQPYLENTIRLVKLSRNFGSYNSFLAGMNHATGDCNVYLHADLQDPPELIEQMFTFFLKDIPLVIAHRTSREDWNVFSSIYHKMVKRYALTKAPEGGYDLIMFNEKIREEVVKIGEKSTNIVYLISWLGYPYAQIPYKRLKRKHGLSQWSTRKKIHLFIDTIFSFTGIPISIIRFLGSITSINLLFSIIYNIFISSDIRSLIWLCTSIIIFLLLIISIILLEYINRIHETVRNRPNFVVENIKVKDSN